MPPPLPTRTRLAIEEALAQGELLRVIAERHQVCIATVCRIDRRRTGKVGKKTPADYAVINAARAVLQMDPISNE